MILEVLVTSTPTHKTFFYESSFSTENQPCIGQIVKLKFRKKNLKLPFYGKKFKNILYS